MQVKASTRIPCELNDLRLFQRRRLFLFSTTHVILQMFTKLERATSKFRSEKKMQVEDSTFKNRLQNVISYEEMFCNLNSSTLNIRYCDWLKAGRRRGRSSIPGKVKNFFFPHPHIRKLPRVLSPWVRRLERDADYSPPTSAEAKKTWIYASTPS
jgi:hypothetical protein